MAKKSKIAKKARKLFKKKSGGKVKKYDFLIEQAFVGRDFVDRAVTKIGLNREEIVEIEPIRFECCDYSEALGEFQIRLFKDGMIRSSNYVVSFLIFGAKQLFIYTYRFSLLNDNISESLAEIDYGAIHAVVAESKYETVTDSSKTCFSVPVTTVQIVADGCKYEVCAPVANSDTEAAILALRNLIRGKK